MTLTKNYVNIKKNSNFFLKTTKQNYTKTKDYKPLKTLKTKTPATAAASRTLYSCQPTDFKCVSHPHTCIAPHMVCDGIHDCTDHSDEFNCTREQQNYKRWKKHYNEPLTPALDAYKRRNKRKFQQLEQKNKKWLIRDQLQNKGRKIGWF